MAEHDAETVRIGRENIARIRAQLADQAESAAEPPPQPAPAAGTDLADTDLADTTASGDGASIDEMRLEMALASEREQLLDTIRRQKDRIAQLETTLAAVIRTAAGGIDSSSTPEPDQTTRSGST